MDGFDDDDDDAEYGTATPFPKISGRFSRAESKTPPASVASARLNEVSSVFVLRHCLPTRGVDYDVIFKFCTIRARGG